MPPSLPTDLLENYQVMLETPLFVQKVYKLVESGADVISWNPDGRSFMVRDAVRLQADLLPLYFNHSNFSSFIRQLHFYGFSKASLSSTACEFRHPYFVRDRPNLLPLIVRKTNESGSAQRRHIHELEERIKELEDENVRLRAAIVKLPNSGPAPVAAAHDEHSAFCRVQGRPESPADANRSQSPSPMLVPGQNVPSSMVREPKRFCPRIIQ